MATSLTSTGITFPDSTTQTTAAIARSGGTTTSSAVNITLTSSSNQVQYVSMTANGLSVVLPDATTLTKGAAIFQICNFGSYDFNVQSADGSVLASVSIGTCSLIALLDNSTSAGVWASSSTVYNLVGVANSLSTATAGASICVEMLSDTLLLVGWWDYTNLKLIAGSISAGAITWGTAVVVKTSVTTALFNVIRAMSGTQAFLGYYTISGSSGINRACYGRGVSVSGTTITLGTETTLGSNSSYYACEIQGADLFGSTLIVSYDTTSTGGALRAATISGSTLTFGTAISTGGGISGSGSGITKYDNTTVLWGYYDGTNFKARFYTLSGTTLTAQGTAFTATSSVGNGVVGSSTKIYAANTDQSYGAPVSSVEVTFSGYTISSITSPSAPDITAANRPTSSGRYFSSVDSAGIYVTVANSAYVSSNTKHIMPSAYGTSAASTVGTSNNYIAQAYTYGGYIGVYVYKAI